MGNLRDILASERVRKKFGLDNVAQTSTPEPKEDIPLEEQKEVIDYAEIPKFPEKEDAGTGSQESLEKFKWLERENTIKEVRRQIQEQVNERMKETKNPQFDIEWDEGNTDRDISGWVRTLAKAGRNTEAIEKAVRSLHEDG